MITDRQIHAKIKLCTAKQPRLELSEKSERGSGRLLLLVRWMEDRKAEQVDGQPVGRKATEWYVKYYHNKKVSLGLV